MDAGGDLWVRQYASDVSDSTRDCVFASDGLLLASVAFADPIAPLEIGTDYVLAVFRDENQVEYVRMYRLTRHP